MAASSFNELVEVAHEALGRMSRNESAGEADLANVARFCHAYLEALKKDGIVMTSEDLESPIQKSLCAKNGPASGGN